MRALFLRVFNKVSHFKDYSIVIQFFISLFRRKLFWAGIFGSALAVLLFLCVAIFIHSPVKQPFDFFVDSGTTGLRIGYRLENQKVISGQRIFRIALFISGKTNHLQAGEYQFDTGTTIWNIIQKIASGQVSLRQLTMVEGHTIKMVLQQITDNPYLQGKITLKPKEGSLLPQTYSYYRGMMRDELIRHMQQSMQVLLDELWAQRDKNILLKNKEEAIILASLVERETGISSERQHIASVFYNRLRNGWPLQTDPTIIYWESDRLGVLNRPIRRSDLRRKHAFNTYLNVNLPPTAIANPGEASIHAVLNPIITDDYFFVADGTGGHVFSKTLAEHNRHVKKWRAIEQERKK